MRVLLLLLCGSLGGLLSAQSSGVFAVSPTQVNLRIRSPLTYPGSTAYPGSRFLYPAKTILVLNTATVEQSWTVSASGVLSNSCLYSTPCFQITGEYNATPVTSGNGATRLAVTWYGTTAPNFPPGNYGGVVTFTPSSGSPVQINVNLEVVDGATLPTAAEVKATSQTEVGCSPDTSNLYPGLFYTFDVNCAIPNEAPVADPALTQPAVGASFTDPTFGGVIRRMTGPGCTTEYGTTTAFSADSTYIIHTCGIQRTADGSLVRAAYPGNISYLSMSAINDQVYYYMTGSTFHSYNFVTGQDSLLADYGAAPYNFVELYGGGTAGTSDDDWISFFDNNATGFPKICAVNLPALVAAGSANNSNTYCGFYSGTIPLGGIDWTGVSNIDGSTGKRYVYLSAGPTSSVFSVGPAGGGALQQEFIVPEWPGYPQNNDDGICIISEICYNSNVFTHLSLFQDSDQQIKLIGNFQDIIQNLYYLSTFRLNSGVKMLRPLEEGGGQQFLARLEFDRQPGCSTAIHGCVTSVIEPGRRFAALVTAASPSGGSTVLTLSASPGWTTGSTRAIRIQNAAGGWVCLNGGWTATVVAGSQISIPASCTGNAVDLAQTVLGDATNPFTGSANDNRGQIVIWRPGKQAHRIAMHRSVAWLDVFGGSGIYNYWAQPRASISRDGRYVAFNSNWGALDFQGQSVYVVGTGLGDPNQLVTIKNVSAGSTTASVNFDAAGGQSCLVEVSANPMFQNLIETFTTLPGLRSKSILLGLRTALTPQTNYWVRLTCGLEVESTTFQTIAAGSVTPLTVSAAVGPPGDGVTTQASLQFRQAGTSVFSTQASQPCSSGCIFSWSASPGNAYEYMVTYFAADGTITKTGDLLTVSAP